MESKKEVKNTKCPIAGIPAEMCCDEGGFGCDVKECPNEEEECG